MCLVPDWGPPLKPIISRRPRTIIIKREREREREREWEREWERIKRNTKRCGYENSKSTN